MFLSMMAFELRYHSKQTVFRAACLVYLLVGMVMARGRLGGEAIHGNAPYTLTYFTAILSLASVIHIALLAGAAVLRDREHKMEAIIFATNLTHAQYVTTRYLGLVAASFLAFVPAVLGLFLAQFLPPFQPQNMVAVHWLPYLWVLAVIALPNILLGVSVIFATATLSRSAMATYISGVGLYVLYWIGSVAGQSPLLAGFSLAPPDQMKTASLLEPYGLISLMDSTRYWTALDKNTNYLPIADMFLLNRLLWLAVAVCTFALAYRFFTFRTSDRVKQKQAMAEANVAPIHYRTVQTVSASARRSWSIFWAQTLTSYRITLKSYPLLALLLLWAGLVFVTLVQQVGQGELGVPYIPHTALLLPMLEEPLMAFGALFMCFFAAEISWQERQFGLSDLIDVTPGPNIAFWGARIATLALVLATLITVTIILSLGFQISKGFGNVDLVTYLHLFPDVGIPLLGAAVLAVLFQSLLPNKYVALGASMVAVVFLSGLILPNSLGIEHPLLRFGFTPEYLLSPMAGDYHGDARFWFLLYALGWTGWFGLLTLRLWRRGRELVSAPVGIAGFGIGLASSLLLIVSGGVLFYHLNIEQPYYTRDQQFQHRADFERSMAEDEKKPELTTTALAMNIDLFPRQRTVTVDGHMTMENQNETAVQEVLIGVAGAANEVTLELEGGALVSKIEGWPYYRFKLDHPLLPGEHTRLRVALRTEISGFHKLNAELYVTPKASYLELDKLLPYCGVDTGYYLEGTRRRQRFGLPPRNTLPDAKPGEHHADHVNYDLRVSTQRDQKILMVGDLVGSEVVGQRLVHHYQGGPVPNAFAIATANYETTADHSGPIPIEVHTVKGHDANASRLIESAKISLAWYEANYGPYPFGSVTVGELPKFSDKFGATAYPGVVYGPENRMFLIDQSQAPIDLSSKAMAHELAHQWWGHQLEPANVAGGRLLTEFFSVYSEIAVGRHRFGPQGNAAYLARTRDLYFFFRGYEERESPLSQVQFQPFIYYFKGAHVAHVLLEVIGADRVNAVLRDMLAGYPYPAKPVAGDFVARLMAAAPEHRALLSELLEQVVTYDVKLQGVKRDGDALQADIFAERIHWEGDRRSEPIDGTIEVALWQGDTLVETRQLFLNKVRSMLVLPNAAGIDRLTLDPRGLLLDPDTNDNEARPSKE